MMDDHTIHQMIVKQNKLGKSLTLLRDDRIVAAWKLDAKWDGEIHFAESGRGVMQDTYYNKDGYFSAAELMSNTGVFNSNDMFLVNQQVERNKAYKRYLKNTPGAKAGDPVKETKEIFRFPFEIEVKLYDIDHQVMAEVPIDPLPSGDWAVLALKKKTVVPKFSCPKIRHRGVRTNGGAGGAGTTRPCN
jgi:hypothetical protein